MHWLSRHSRLLSAFEGDDLALQLTYRYWQEKRDGGLLPSRCAIDTPAFRLLVPEVDWLDIGTRDAAARSGLGRLHSLSEAAPGPGTHDPRPLGALLRSDLETVRFTGSCICQDLRVDLAGTPGIWRMLLLPTADDGIRVREIMLLARPVAASQPVVASRHDHHEELI